MTTDVQTLPVRRSGVTGVGGDGGTGVYGRYLDDTGPLFSLSLKNRLNPILSLLTRLYSWNL